MGIKTHVRAARGGQYGANGEWYEGGKFINTVPENAKRHKKAIKGTGKVEIAPYVWEVPPEGKRSIWSKFAGFEGALIRNNLGEVSDVTIAYFGLNRAELVELAQRWHAGERWIGRTDIRGN
jgi:hypothetical protein